MIPLYRHADTPPGSTRAVAAEMTRTAGGAELRWVIDAPASALILPAAGSGQRRHDLWRGTCGEAFIALDGDAYLELNASPSGDWAAYRFDSYRAGMTPAEATMQVQCEVVAGEVTIIATLTADLPMSAPVGLTAVVVEQDGLTRYWATSFAPGAPDFHHAAVRCLILDAVGAE